MSENTATNTSPLDGVNVPQAGVYKGFNAHLTLAGVVIARAQEVTFTVDNNIEPYYELGSRTPWYVEGNFDCRGTIRGMVFDTMKVRLAIGNERDVVGASPTLQTIDTATVLNNADLTPAAGTQPWWKLYQFTITLELHIDGTDNFMEYKLDKCKIDVLTIRSTQDTEVSETINFFSPRVGVRMVTGT